RPDAPGQRRAGALGRLADPRPDLLLSARAARAAPQGPGGAVRRVPPQLLPPAAPEPVRPALAPGRPPTVGAVRPSARRGMERPSRLDPPREVEGSDRPRTRPDGRGAGLHPQRRRGPGRQGDGLAL